MTWKYFNGYGALIGVAIPLLVMLIDELSVQGWWPSWLLFVWPSSYMLISTAGTKDFAAYMIIVVSILLNGILYGVIGALLVAGRKWCQ